MSARRRLAWLLWPLVILWAALVITRAAAELTAAEPVTGLTRTWDPPYDASAGHVIDPRPMPRLLDEIRARYAPAHPPIDTPDPAVDAPASAWTSALTALGLTPTPYTRDDWPGAPPRLRLPGPDSDAPPHLLIGLIGLDPVVAWPGLGVLRIPRDRLPPAAHDLALTGAREQPW